MFHLFTMTSITSPVCLMCFPRVPQVQPPESDEKFDSEEVRAFISSHMPEAQQKEGEVGDLVYSLPAYNAQNASAYRSLLTALDRNLDALQLGCYGISDTTLEEVRE